MRPVNNNDWVGKWIVRTLLAFAVLGIIWGTRTLVDQSKMLAVMEERQRRTETLTEQLHAVETRQRYVENLLGRLDTRVEQIMNTLPQRR